MTDSSFKTFKAAQKESWGAFAPMEVFTTMPAATLVNFSRIKAGCSVLDVGCGTGVLAITAARMKAHVSALDLSPALLERAHINSALAQVDIAFTEGDVEELPYPDSSFDAVLSQFGHMFAPRPHIATQEMLRVLKPGGIIAFSTWPPDLYVGRLFKLTSKFAPPTADASPPWRWGEPRFVREQLGNAVIDLNFHQGVMLYPALSVGQYRQTVETTVGPILKLVQESKNNPTKLEQFRREFEMLASEYFVDNHIQQYFLMSRGKKIV